VQQSSGHSIPDDHAALVDSMNSSREAERCLKMGLRGSMEPDTPHTGPAVVADPIGIRLGALRGNKLQLNFQYRRVGRADAVFAEIRMPGLTPKHPWHPAASWTLIANCA